MTTVLTSLAKRRLQRLQRQRGSLRGSNGLTRLQHDAGRRQHPIRTNLLHLFFPFRKSDTPEIDRRVSSLLSILMTFYSQLSPSPLFKHSSTHTQRHTCARTHTQSHHRCHRGDGGHLIVFCPGLQVLQGVERGVGQAERVGLQRLAQRLLESFLLKLQHQPVGLLPLGLPLLRGLSPGWAEATKKRRRRRRRCTVRPLWVCAWPPEAKENVFSPFISNIIILR